MVASRLEARRAEEVVRDKGRKARVIEAIATGMRGSCIRGRGVWFSRVQVEKGKRRG
jgi:hypothetical protein